MQVDNSTQPHTSLPPNLVSPDPTILSLLPLCGYHQKLSITAPSLPTELIVMIQAFCSHDNLLDLTAVDKAAWATRFRNPRLQKLHFLTVEKTEQFLSYCQEKPKEVENRFLQEIKALTLTIPDQFTAEQYDSLFGYLSEIEHLTIYSAALASSLSPLFKAVPLTLHRLAIINPSPSTSTLEDPPDYDEYQCIDEIVADNLSDELYQYNEIVEDNLPDELWRLTTLETLTISGFEHVVSIPESIGKLNALKSLTLKDMDSLNVLPASLGQLETLTLEELCSITALPEEIGQITALKSLKLNDLWKLEALPASLGQLNKLKALTLSSLPLLTALPEEIGQLRALKSLTLGDMSLEALPASLGQLNKLEALTLDNLRSITELPEEIGQLRALKVVKLIDMTQLETLPGKLAQIVI
jgi:Leucine-rich repeat (LRR) protein